MVYRQSNWCYQKILVAPNGSYVPVGPLKATKATPHENLKKPEIRMEVIAKYALFVGKTLSFRGL
jgi:hypothetical protein